MWEREAKVLKLWVFYSARHRKAFQGVPRCTKASLSRASISGHVAGSINLVPKVPTT